MTRTRLHVHIRRLQHHQAGQRSMLPRSLVQDSDLTKTLRIDFMIRRITLKVHFNSIFNHGYDSEFDWINVRQNTILTSSCWQYRFERPQQTQTNVTNQISAHKERKLLKKNRGGHSARAQNSQTSRELGESTKGALWKRWRMQTKH